jgi:hypothetical protein
MCKVLDGALVELQCTNIETMKRFAARIREIHGPKTALISTNYDIVLDNALLNLDICNYGTITRMILEHGGQDPSQAEMSIGIGGSERFFKAHPRTYPPLPSTSNKGKLPLLKLHGSLNWLWCPRCQELDITAYEKGALRAQHHNYICPARHCTSPYEILIVTPTLFKVYDNRIVKEVWQRAEEAISMSKCLVFIGYSLPEADIHIRCMITRATANAQQRPKILVVDYDSPNNPGRTREVDATEKRYKRLLGDNVRFERYGFQYFVNNVDDIMTNLSLVNSRE